MSSFTKPLITEVLSNKNFLVYQAFDYYLDEEDGIVIDVSVGFVTDFATTPRWLWWLLPPIGRYSKAAVIHDYMYGLAILSKKDADRAFYNAMKILKVPGWKRYIMYQAVKYFGIGNY